MNELKQRILDISFKHHLSHIGSNLTAVDIIDEIYQEKKKDEPFILSAGHAGLALYVVQEKYGGRNAEEVFNHHGVHPDRCTACGLSCSTGSLGMGLPIAVGMAIAERQRKVWCLISDGEASEGSIWESLNMIQKYQVRNLKLYANINGYGAYDPIESSTLIRKLKVFDPFIRIRHTTVEQVPFLHGIDAHYYVMKEQDHGKT